MSPPGGEGVAAFETVSFADSEVPQGMVFMCQHKTRETVWLPELIEHENGAIGLSAIVIIAADPETSAKGFARLFKAGKAVEHDGGWKVLTGPNSADLLVLDREKASSLYPNVDLDKTPASAFATLRIRVRSLDKARAALTAHGVSFASTEAGVAVLPENASGTILEFSEQ